MRGGVTRKKLLTRRKVADLTREIGLGHGGSLNTRIKEFVRPALTSSGAKLTRACVPRTVNGTGQRNRNQSFAHGVLWSVNAPSAPKCAARVGKGSDRRTDRGPRPRQRD